MGPLKFIRRRALKAFRKRARSAQREQRWSTALVHWRRVYSLDPNNANALLQIANMHNELGQFDHALETFGLAELISSHSVHAQIGMAGVLERRGDFAGALSHWEAALVELAGQETRKSGTHVPSPLSAARILLHVSVCRHSIGDVANAERDLFIAIALEPRLRTEREALLLRARILSKQDIAAAYVVLRKGHETYPRDYAILFELTKIAAAGGNRIEAARNAAALLALDPANETTKALVTGLALPA